MTSFMQTMLVPTSPQSHFPQSPRPLPAQHSPVLAQSESCLRFFPSSIDSPPPLSSSPLQRHIQYVFGYIGGGSGDGGGGKGGGERGGRVGGSKTKMQSHGTQTPLSGLGPVFDGAGKMADLLTRSNSNAAKNKTAFQPQKRAKGQSSWQLKQFAEATLGSGSLRKVVQLPEGEDRDEWLAINVVDFYNQINLLYGAITEFCSPQSCPEMKATDEFEYLWHDPPQFPKPTRLPAPTYISHLLTWTSNHLSNPAVFPTQPGVPFPADFEKTIKVIFKRLYRVYAHIYCHHYGVIRGLGLEAHLNTGFKHYVLFVEEFGLADERGARKGDWWGPLGELVESMLRSD